MFLLSFLFASALFEDVAEAKGDNADNVKAAEKLLKEVGGLIGVESLRYVILDCLLLSFFF